LTCEVKKTVTNRNSVSGPVLFTSSKMVYIVSTVLWCMMWDSPKMLLVLLAKLIC